MKKDINMKNVIRLLIAAAIRYVLMSTAFFDFIQNRVEISTPLNAFKRIQEGVHLYNNEIDPYSGDIVHEHPIILLIFSWIFNNIPQIIPFLYIFLDLLTGLLLHKMTKEFLKQKLIQQEKEKSKYADDTIDIQYHKDDLESIPDAVLMVYLFNPLSIANCVSLTSTVFSNLLLSAYFYFLSKKMLFMTIIILAFESVRNLYPFVLISPIVLVFYKNSAIKAISICGLFIAICSAYCFLSSILMQSWTFLHNTLGFIFFYEDLTPNIGLFWYFFTEMFEHFRTMFLITFQMNATILYLLPLTIKLRKDPLMLGIVLTALMAIFRSYPCFGDVAFYLSLLPTCKRFWKFTAHNFVVFCFFLITIIIMPTFWHLWIYIGSANANFYFGATLAFCTGQIFLVTDILFAYVKREFCLKNGQNLLIDGKKAKIVLE